MKPSSCNCRRATRNKQDLKLEKAGGVGEFQNIAVLALCQALVSLHSLTAVKLSDSLIILNDKSTSFYTKRGMKMIVLYFLS
jgi:hypothetical protein